MQLCRAEEEAEYGARVEMNQTAVETLKMFHSQADLDTFLASSQVSAVLLLYCTVLYCTVLQASFWRSRGYEFSALSVAECQQLEPALAPATARHGLLDNEVNTESV